MNKQIYNLDYIIRYSNVPRIKDETVAAHSFFVAMEVYQLREKYVFNLDKAIHIALCHDLPETYIDDFVNAGADIIAVLEPLAVLLSPKQFQKFSLYPFKRLISNLNNRPLVLHICGNTNHLIKLMCDSGAIGLSLDSGVNFEELKKIVPEKIALIGNLDPTEIFLQSTPDQVVEATMSLRESMKDVKNFVLSSGCDIPINAPLENIAAFMKAARG